MADNVAGSAAWLGGTEIVNDSRTTAYMRNGIKPSTLNVNGDCGCANILTLAGCDIEYTTPAQDGAPWYDANAPESAEFAGFLTTEFEGLGSTYTRSVAESIGDGATLGRSRFGSRTLTWKGYLFGSSCCGVAYGLRWLGSILRTNSRCGTNCFGDDLEILVCCPTIEAALGYGPDLICNSDFEDHVGYWTATGNTALSWTNAEGYLTPGAMKVVNPIDGMMTWSTSAECNIPITPLKIYKLSLQAKAADGAASQVIGAVFNWYNNIDAFLGTTTLANMGSDTSGEWTLIEGSVTAPVTAARVTIDFIIGDAFTLPGEIHYVDDIEFHQTNFAPTVEPFRTIKNVSLLEGPLILSERKMGNTCGGSCGGAAAMEVEFSLIGAQPWLYSAPIPVVNCVNLQENSVPIVGGTLTGTITDNPLTNVATTINSPDFADLPLVVGGGLFIILDPYAVNGQPEVVQVTSHTVGATSITVVRGEEGTVARQHPLNTFWLLQTECGPDNCADGLLEIIATLPNYDSCAPPSLPPTSTYTGCFVPDVNDWQAVYVTAPRVLWNSISEVVPVITIEVGALPLVGARIGFYSSADGNPCGDIFSNPPSCDLVCDTLFIVGLPNNSKFYIDGRTRKMSLICGSNTVFPGEPYTLGPFSWPSFDCYGFCMEFAYDPRFITNDRCISLSLVPRTAM